MNPCLLKEQIVREIEFYFGDCNLRRDKFMKKLIQQDNGWILLGTIMNFPRMKRLCTDPRKIAESMADSLLVEIDMDLPEPKIRRKLDRPLKKLVPKQRKALNARTIYYKGLPQVCPMDALLNSFKQYAAEHIIKLKYKDRYSKKMVFSGAVFVTFRTRKLAEAFMKIPQHEISNLPINRLWKEDYLKLKIKNVEEKKARKKIKQKERKRKRVQVVHLSGNFSGIQREDIEKGLKKFKLGHVYVAFHRGDLNAFLVLPKGVRVERFTRKAGPVWKVGNTSLDVSVLGEPEKSSFLSLKHVIKRREKWVNSVKVNRRIRAVPQRPFIPPYYAFDDILDRMTWGNI